MRPLPRGIGGSRIIDRAQEARLPLDIGEGLALVPGMVAERQAVSARIEELFRNGAGQAEAASRVLGVHNGKVEPQAGFEAGQMVQHGLAARLSDDVSEKSNLHGLQPMHPAR